MRFRPIEILETLAGYKVKFVLVGGYAGNVRTSDTLTLDLDICYQRERRNLDRLVRALREMNARLRGADDDVPFLLDAETLEKGSNFTFMTDLGPLDLIGSPAGVDGYDELIRNATAEPFDGIQIHVCSLEDLIRMKEAAGRPKDLIELEILRAIQEDRRGREED